MKKLSKGFMCFVWLMFCLKKLLMVCSRSKFCAIDFIGEEVVKQLLNVTFALGFLLMTIILGQNLTGSLF